MSFLASVIQSASRGVGFRSSAMWPERFTVDDIASLFKIGDIVPNFTMQAFREQVSGDFAGLVEAAYRGNAIVFACELVRFSLFSEIRFKFQRLSDSELFGNQSLSVLEHPEPGKTTGDLMSRALLHHDLAGNWYGVRRPGVRGGPDRIKTLRPDWTSILMGSPNPAVDLPAHDPDIEVIGYAYWPGGMWSGVDPITYDVSEVAHFAFIPDPLASYRGMAWLTPVIRELKADTSATQHKLQFFENAATPQMIVKFEPGMDPDKVRAFIEVFEQNHAGVINAYRTAYLGGGADATVVGSSLHEMDFKSTQGAGETRIAAAAGIHPTIVGLSEGLAGSSLNAGNFGAARRLTADKTLRPLWRNMAGSLEQIVTPPDGARLWYDVRDVAFLSEDVKDAAEVLNLEATAMRTLADGGWEPDSVVAAVTSGELRRLVHSGLPSVQVQPGPRVVQPDAEAALLDAPPIAGLLESGEQRCDGLRVRDGIEQVCGKLLMAAGGGPYVGTCPRCKKVYEPEGAVLRVEAPRMLRIVRTADGATIEELPA